MIKEVERTRFSKFTDSNKEKSSKKKSKSGNSLFDEILEREMHRVDWYGNEDCCDKHLWEDEIYE